MEKHLSWMVGMTGVLMLAVTSPLLTMGTASPANGNNLTATEGTVLTADAATNIGSQYFNTDTGALHTREIGTHIRQAGTVAKHAVGGGSIKQLTTSKLNGQDVYQVYISKPQTSWVVNVSMNDYSILHKQQLV